ncbi:MFS transporter [Streptomyces sp. NPDC047315]|uniref:MFS transporter n=1 Tax=Streptomyces sp. NPDC047315 TaxID=3155142 RepID=UPI0033FEA0F1
MTPVPDRPGAPAALSRRTLLLLALTCAVAVGNVYFPQALVPLLAADLGTSTDAAATVVTATQLGYAAGILLVVPLGDRFAHRPLLVALLATTAVGLLAAGSAPALPVLVAACALVGLTTVAAQVIGPMAAGLVPADRVGAVMGTLLSGSIGGMLLARAFGGALGEAAGWRTPYLVAAGLVALLAVVLFRTAPATAAATRRAYPALVAEALRLLRSEPELRRSCLYQAAVFGAFSAVWTCAALLLTGPAYALGAQAVGVLALVGAVTMVVAPLAGRLVDRRGPNAVTLGALLATVASAALLVPGAAGGATGLVALVVGTLLLDLALQAGTIANQARVFALRPDARARLNTAYMTLAYLGGAAGSWLGVRAYGAGGWRAVCAVVALLGAVGLLGWTGRSLRVKGVSGACHHRGGRHHGRDSNGDLGHRTVRQRLRRRLRRPAGRSRAR